MQLDIEDMERQIEEGISKIEQNTKEIEEKKVITTQLMIEIEHLQEEKKNEFTILLNYDGIPRKLKKQSDSLAGAIQALRAQEQRQMERIAEHEGEIVNLHNNCKALTEEHAKASANVDKIRSLTEQKMLSVSELKKEFEMASLEADQYLADRVNLDIQLKAAQMELKGEQEHLAQCLKEKDRIIRKLKHADSQFKSIQSTIPNIMGEKEKVHRQAMLAQSETKKASACVQELKKEFDLQKHNYLGIENISKEVSTKLREGYKEVERLEKEVSDYVELEYASYQQMGELTSLREHMCRLVSSKVHMCNEAKEKMRASDIMIGFLKKRDRDVEDQYNNFTKLFNLLSTQRNKFATLIQASALTLAELKDKLKRLEVEVNMLQAEVLYKDKVLTKMREEYTSSILKRFHIRSDIIKCSILLQKKKDIADENVLEVERFQSNIRNAEKEMERFRKQYKADVTDRNFTGISLIDRNDELCILYEKLNVQEELLKHSDIEMLKRENEISSLNIEVRNTERSILICFKFVPESRQLQKMIRDLKSELKRVAAEGERLSALVEMPENTARWRLLEGCDPSETQLMSKLSDIEEHLSEKEDQSQKKDWILEEVTALADDLRKQAGEAWDGNLNISRQVVFYQDRLRTITRRMMATVSELSLSQATAISLQKEKEALTNLLQDARAKLEAVEAPIDDAQQELMEVERDEMDRQG